MYENIECLMSVMLRITDVIIECTKCDWWGTVDKCDCDADLDGVPDDGRLRCPECASVAVEVGWVKG